MVVMVHLKIILKAYKLILLPFHIVYAFIKNLVFAFILATIPSYYGYYMKGGALEVGKGKYYIICLDKCCYHLSKLFNNQFTFRLMIEVKNLHKSFGDAHILKGISTSFEKGKTNFIIGQSGSGKTVFLKCLLGII